ncbi:MAG: peptide deformylase [Rhodospirillales bacterium 20-60-12]|nr:MAG: peptide deformylase [Rhodospirillales bacterium 20-60-12]HQT66125.1 peptide deformylase [Acetobacteraceae bacterium]HQU02454.1 peptide deformylase [Acetobacteraceae bacterium]
MSDQLTENLPILIVPAKILRLKARPVTRADQALVDRLIPRMFASMYAAPGIGLAAPQVGASLRLIVIDLMADQKPEPLVMINPEIVAASTEQATREEGCLSLPGQYAEITRPARVKVRFEDQAGVRRDLDAEGLFAACIQHEIDHLNGVLFVDYLSSLKRNILLRKLAKEQKIAAEKKAEKKS